MRRYDLTRDGDELGCIDGVAEVDDAVSVLVLVLILLFGRWEDNSVDSGFEKAVCPVT